MWRFVPVLLIGCWSAAKIDPSGGTTIARPTDGQHEIGRVLLGMAPSVRYDGEIVGDAPQLGFTEGAVTWRTYAAERACFRFDRWSLGSNTRDEMERPLVLETSDGVKLTRWGATAMRFGEVRTIAWRERHGDAIETRTVQYQRAFADVCFDTSEKLVGDATRWVALRDGDARFRFRIDPKLTAMAKQVVAEPPVATREPIAPDRAGDWIAKARITTISRTPFVVGEVELHVRLEYVARRMWLKLQGRHVDGCGFPMTDSVNGRSTMIAQRLRCGAGTITSAEIDLVTRSLRLEVEEGLDRHVINARL